MKLSFVIPCYRSQNTVMKVVDEIEVTVKQRPEYDYEIILVNDGSPDNVWQVIYARALEDEHVIGINLSKNFGQHCALMAGFNNVSGDYVITIDDDGQTPAFDIFKLVDELEKGYDTVYASYPETHQNAFRRWGSDFNKKISDYILDIKNDDRKASSFYICRRYIIDEITKYDHSYPYITGLMVRATRNYSFVEVQHRDRLEGTSGYNVKSLVGLWLNMFTAFSIKPLRIASYSGFAFALMGLLYATYVVIKKLFINPEMEAGWSSTISVIMIIGGMIMIILGLIGEYLGRIYMCINHSPQYVIKDIVGK